jgi:hypothetical protein
MFIALISFMAVVLAFSLVLTITTLDSRSEPAEVIVFLDKTVEVGSRQN